MDLPDKIRYTIADIAQATGRSYHDVYNAIRRNGIKGSRNSRRRSDVLEYSRRKAEKIVEVLNG